MVAILFVASHTSVWEGSFGENTEEHLFQSGAYRAAKEVLEKSLPTNVKTICRTVLQTK